MRAPSRSEWEARMAFREIERDERRKAASRRRHELVTLHSKGLLDVDSPRALWPSQGNSYGVVE